MISRLLPALYYRADGFESAGKDQVRRTMYGRIRSLRTWVAESQGQLQSAASTSAETAQAAMIGGVWTAPVARNRGLSTAVTAALSRELLAEGRRPYLFYLTDNAAAARVYSQVGFSTIGRLVGDVFDAEAVRRSRNVLIKMQKPLTAAVHSGSLLRRWLHHARSPSFDTGDRRRQSAGERGTP